MSARDRLWYLYQHPGSALDFEDALADYAHELAERIRQAQYDENGPAMKWNWWDSATIPSSCADLIDPKVK